MNIPDRLNLAGGILIGLTGLGMLVSLDLPAILGGGIAAVAAAVELLLAVTLLSAGFGIAARGYGDLRRDRNGPSS